MEDCAYGSNNCIWRSVPHVINFLSRVQHMPLTMFSCALACHISSLLVKSHTLTIPSPLPDAKCSRELGSFAKEYTPSTWPGSKLPRKGCANMRSTLVALRALVYSRARSNGCLSTESVQVAWQFGHCAAHRFGSKFLVTFATFEPGAWVEAVDRLSALIFILAYRGCLRCETRRRELSCGSSRFREARRGQPDVALQTLAWQRGQKIKRVPPTSTLADFCLTTTSNSTTKVPDTNPTTATMKL